MKKRGHFDKDELAKMGINMRDSERGQDSMLDYEKPDDLDRTRTSHLNRTMVVNNNKGRDAELRDMMQTEHINRLDRQINIQAEASLPKQ